MTQPATRILLLLILVLTGGLVALWFNPNGSLRNAQWEPPLAVIPELNFSDTLPVPSGKVDVNLFAATLESPLFSPNRKPPPPPKPKEEEKPPAPDPFADIHLFGLYGGDDSPSGMLARIEGKVRRVSVKETLGGWTLKSIEDRNAIFVRGGEERKLELKITKPAPPAPPVAARTPGAPTEATAAAPSSVGDTPEQRMERVRQERAERLRRRNAARAQAGAAPIESQ